MQVVLKDGPRKGETIEVSKNEGSFDVILTENPAYKTAQYLILPLQTKLKEQVATFIGMTKREKR